MNQFSPEEIQAMRDRHERYESAASEQYKAAFGHEITPSQLTISLHEISGSEGWDYVAEKRHLNSLPGPVGRAFTAAKEAGFDALAAGGSFVVDALTQRTEGVEPEMSGGPVLRVPEAIGAPLSALQRGVGLTPGQAFNVLPGMGGQRIVSRETGQEAQFDPQDQQYYFPDGSRATPANSVATRPDPTQVTLGDVGQAAIGLETAADAVELFGPFVAELAILSRQATPLGYASRMMGANIGTELSAEYMRALDRKMSGMYSGALDFSNPVDAADHFLNVIAGGAILGATDASIGQIGLRAERQTYQTLFGLGKKGSNERIARARRLGVEPSLAMATDGFMRAMFSALSAYPMTGRKALKEAQEVTRNIFSSASTTIHSYADFAGAGLALSQISKRFFLQNKNFLNYIRDTAQDVYKGAVRVTQDVERNLGLDQVHVPHATIRDELERQIFPQAAGQPLARAGKKTAIPDLKTTGPGLMNHPDWKYLDQLLNLDDKVSIPEYIILRNQIEFAAQRAKASGDPFHTVFVGASAQMRKALNSKVAPDEIRKMWEIADDKWKGMNHLLNGAVWKKFKRVESSFPETDPKSTSVLSSEMLARELFNDPKFAPEFADTLYKVAKGAGAQRGYSRVVSGYLSDVFNRAASVAEKGPLAGLEIINLAAFEKSLGLGGANDTRWQAVSRLITNSGGDPKVLRQFIEDAKQLFPDGIPNPSQTAARRTGLAGIGSAVRFMTGGGVVGAASGTAAGGVLSVTGGVTGAVAGLLAFTGLGSFAFDTWSLKYMSQVMTGNLSEQARWRKLLAVASAAGVVRPFRALLQESGIAVPLDEREIYRATQSGRTRGLSDRRPSPATDMLQSMGPQSDPLLQRFRSANQSFVQPETMSPRAPSRDNF